MKFDFNQFLNRKGLKQQQAADLIGVTQATISNWCKGKTPDYETFSKLIGYGMTAQEMFGEDSGAKISDADCEKIAEFVYSRMSGKKRE